MRRGEAIRNNQQTQRRLASAKHANMNMAQQRPKQPTNQTPPRGGRNVSFDTRGPQIAPHDDSSLERNSHQSLEAKGSTVQSRTAREGGQAKRPRRSRPHGGTSIRIEDAEQWSERGQEQRQGDDRYPTPAGGPTIGNKCKYH